MRSGTKVNSREIFLASGEALVLRAGDVGVVSSMSVADLIDAAPAELSRGAFTHHWPTRSAFETDLLLHVAHGIRQRSGERTARLFEIVVENVGKKMTLRDFVLDAITRSMPQLLASVDQRVLLSLWSKAATNETVRELLSANWRGQDRVLAERLHLLLAVFGYEMRPGHEVGELAAALSSLVQVSFIRGLVIADDDDLAPDLWADMVVSTIRAFAGPAD